MRLLHKLIAEEMLALSSSGLQNFGSKAITICSFSENAWFFL